MAERTADDYIFFWKPDQEHGWASQWYPSPFSAHITLPDGEEREVVFPTAEHWMMGQKALLFGDKAIFLRIVGLPPAPTPTSPPTTTSEAPAGETTRTRPRPRSRKARPVDPQTVRPRRPPSAKAVKALGRKVRSFDEETWVRERERIVLEGTLLKFRQNAELRRALLGTGQKEIVEASPLDRVWGIGVGPRRAGEMCESAEMREGWGLNLLGRALGEARRILREEGGDVGPSSSS